MLFVCIDIYLNTHSLEYPRNETFFNTLPAVVSSQGVYGTGLIILTTYVLHPLTDTYSRYYLVVYSNLLDLISTVKN